MISIDKFTELAHRTASRYSHRTDPARVFYTFTADTLADFHRRLCSEAESRAAVPAGWQPIETAPKDEAVLLYGAKRLEMCVGMNHSRDGWVTDTTSEWASMYPPTHWMPLPAAPGAAAPKPVAQPGETYTAADVTAAHTKGYKLGMAQAKPEQAAQPMFWVRLCSNGMYEGPIHDKQIEDVRRNSGAWSPLYLGTASTKPKD